MKKIFLILLFLSFNVHAQSAWSPRWLPAYGDVPINGDIYSVTGKANLAISSAGLASNCSVLVSGTTFTIKGDGTNNGSRSELSSSNPCHVGIKGGDGVSGAVARFTSNVDFTFGSASQTDGNLFGLTDQNYTETMPFFIGVLADPTQGSTNHKFVLSRVRISASGTTGELCQLGDTSCDSQKDVMILSTGLTLSNWQNMPITWVGWTVGSYATSGGAWTFYNDIGGFNDDWKRKTFYHSYRFLANGGTAPVFSSGDNSYTMTDTGPVMDFYFTGDGGTDGAGAVQTQLDLPYRYIGNVFTSCGNAIVQGATTISGETWARLSIANNSNVLLFSYQSAAATSASITNAMFSNGGRYIAGQCRINAW